MTLPNLTSNYLQYKADTDYVAAWLARTALLCGYPAGILHRSQSTRTTSLTQTSQRLKEELLDPLETLQTETKLSDNLKSASNSPMYTIPVQQFTDLAEYIAGSSTVSVEIPRVFVEALKRAIFLREEHGARTLSILGNENEDEIFTPLISILERVLDILQPQMPADVVNDIPAASPGDRKQPDAEIPVNQFSKIETQKLSKEFSRAPAAEVSGTKDSTAATPNYKAETLQGLNDALFLFSLFMNDMKGLQNVILNMWANVLTRSVDLVSASMATNTAIDLVRRIEDEITPVLNRQDSGPMSFYEAYLNMIVVTSGHDLFYREEPDDDSNFHAYAVLEDHFYNIHELLISFRRAITESIESSESKFSYLGTYDMNSDWDTKSNREKYAEDKAILWELLLDLFISRCSATDFEAEDELIQGLRDVFKGKDNPVPIWLTFAAQLFLGLHHILRNQIGVGFEELKRESGIISVLIRENLASFDISGNKHLLPADDKFLQRLLQVTADNVDTNIDHKASQQRACSNFNLLKHHPVLCGLNLYVIRQRIHGFATANSSNLPRSSAD